MQECFKDEAQKLTLILAEACDEMRITMGTAPNKIGNGACPIPLRIQGKNRVIDIAILASTSIVMVRTNSQGCDA
jgi:hypothetical protein